MDSPSRESCVAVILQCVKASLADRDGGDCTNLLIVLRELLMNAIVHGNAGLPQRRVLVSVSSAGEKRFVLEVEDEGAGFDYRRLVMTPPADPAHLAKKGYVLIHMLAEEIRFNEEGNRVEVTLCLGNGRGKSGCEGGVEEPLG